MSVTKLPAIPNIRIKDNETNKAVMELNNSLKPAVKFVNESKSTIDDVKSNMPQLKELVALLPDVKNIVNSTISKGKEVSATFTSAQSQAIAHGLGRVPTGWFIIDNDSFTQFKRNHWDSNEIILESSDAATIKIWVF